MKPNGQTTINFDQVKSGMKGGGCYRIATLNLPPKSEKDVVSRPTVEIFRNSGTGDLILHLNDHQNHGDSMFRATVPTYCVGTGQVTFAPRWADGPIMCSVVAQDRVVNVKLSLEQAPDFFKGIEVQRPIITSSPEVQRIERQIKAGANPSGDSDDSLLRGGWHVPTGLAPTSRCELGPADRGTCQERVATAAMGRGQSFDAPPGSLFASTPPVAASRGILPQSFSLHGRCSGGRWHHHAASGGRLHRPMR